MELSNNNMENLNNTDTNILSTMPIFELLIKMSVPIMISMFVLACYNFVDSIFISRISEEALSALSLAYPVQFFMLALNIGTNVGVSTLISRSLGSKKHEDANNFARHGIFIALMYSIIFNMVGIFFSETLFRLMTTDEVIIENGVTYLSIILIFSFGFFIETTYEKIMQATGKSILSMITQLSGAVFNIIFDPILIFGYFGFPKMGVRGAAIATVAGQIFGMFVGFALNKIYNKELKIEFFKLKLNYKILYKIYRVGLPSIIMQSIGSFMITGLNIILIKYPSAVAILGIYYKIQSFIFMPVFGLNNGMVPIVSYNFGAKNKERILKVIKYAIISAVIIMLIGTFIVVVFPHQILSFFNASDEMQKIGTIAFRIIAIHFVIVAPNVILSSVMQATKKEVYSLVASIIRQIVILLPTAYIMSMLFDLNQVWLAFPISEFICFIIIIILFKKTYKDKISTLNAT